MNRSWHRGWLALLVFWICTSAPHLSVAGTDAGKSPLDPWWTEPQPIRISLTLSPEAIESLRKDPRQNVSASIREGGTEYPDVRIHLKGSIGSFRSIDEKPGFTVSFAKSDAHPLFHGNSKIHLNNSVEDPTYLNEKLGTILFARAGIPATELRHALVELNGKPLGMYVLKEGFTREFLSRHFSNPSGLLYENDNPGKTLGQTDISGQTFGPLELVAKMPSVSDRWVALTNLIDLASFIQFMAIEVMIGHRDGYCIAWNNYRVYSDRLSGRLIFLPHGMDQLFGRPDFPWRPNMTGPVARMVMERSEGQEKYRSELGSMLTNVFDLAALEQEVDRTAPSLIGAVASAERPALSAAIAGLKARLRQRKEFLLSELSRSDPKPLAFVKNVAVVGNWKPVDVLANVQAAQTNSPDGLPSLYIHARAAAAASWRSKVLLERGVYRFEGNVLARNVRPIGYGKNQGVTLRIAGGRSKAEARLMGTSAWRTLGADFGIGQDKEEVELICEVRASDGEIWFDLGSLKLVRLDLQTQ
jgi:hypothetical protein